LSRKTYKRYKARTPETKARIAESVRAYHARARAAIAQLQQPTDGPRDDRN